MKTKSSNHIKRDPQSNLHINICSNSDNLWAWAVNVAVEISSPTPDSRLMHVMFALMSPSLYLFYAYTQKGV